MRVLGIKEYAKIREELSNLKGTHFQRILKLEDGTYRIKLGSQEILISLGVAVYITRRILPGEADQFCQRVKKELDNARLVAVHQYNHDRILHLEFDKATLIIEGFGKGNMILIKDGIILAAVKHETWSDREILPKKEYKPPRSSTKTNIDEIYSEKYVIVDLMKLPLGKEYAKELLTRIKIEEKTPSAKISSEQKTKIEKEYEKITHENTPYLFLDDAGQIIDYGLVAFSTYKNIKEMPSLSDALDQYYAISHAPPNPKLEKLKSRLEHQKARVEGLKKEYEESMAKGNYIYEHFQKIEAVKSEIEKCPLDEIDKRFEKIGAKTNKKEKTVEIQLG